MYNQNEWTKSLLISIFDTVSTPKSVHMIMVDTYRIMINAYVEIP